MGSWTSFGQSIEGRTAAGHHIMQELLQDDVGKRLRQVSYADQSPAMGALVKVVLMLFCKLNQTAA